ncbi:putative U3 small nucleolar RNA-associated protein 7 [Tetrabaena socialis]|uniref:Putative U3 small nucleolar RNA-associated protein 7 n=1 Tax=Tetrabaena socialis TaxID=47790 RepID=A0A2J7ZVI9_9CHLO|nr:putative U3 small nucleolar RNA-associated protein 7 [Tetrabaena socialis]|eukprot:PNH04286.1 putative U3 small nucleolar RNA-associated protein 7 [Tetrabaena socialis]
MAGGDEPARPTDEGKEGKKRKKRQLDPDTAATAKRLKRGPGVDLSVIKDKKLKGKLRRAEGVFSASQKKAVQITEWLLPATAGTLEAEGVERTWNFKQVDIVGAVDVTAARKAFDLNLPDLGPYSLSFSRNGRFMLMGGRLGHLALMDWQRSHLVCEVQVRETVRDVTFLHNETFWAAAQRKYVYVYDKRGLEIHCLRDHTEVHALDFLPHHFMLVSVGEHGVLRYQDTSTGHIVAQHKTKLGPCATMRHNPHNAVVCLGHARGCVTMWTPNLTTPAVKMLCHQVRSSGEPNFDSLVANPFQSVKQRQQGEVVALLDKLQPDTIVLDPDSVGRVRKEPADVVRQRRAEEQAANAESLASLRREAEGKIKMKGKNKPSRRHRKKQSNIIEDRKPSVKQKQQEEATRKKEAAQKKAEDAIPEDAPRAVRRFYKGGA